MSDHDDVIPSETRRPTVSALEALLFAPTPVLDHGFVRVIDYMGDDRSVTAAARVSYGRGTRRISEDTGLIRYLMRHRHCYHPDMQVLTVCGWKRWRDCGAEETFLVPDPASRTYRIETLKVFSFSTVETMCTFRNGRMSYCVTGSHNMWFKGHYQGCFRKVRANEMSKWGWFDPITGYQQEGEVSGEGDAKFRFIGFFLGDGTGASANRITFHLKKPRKRDYLEQLLEELRLAYSVRPSGTHADGLVYYVETPEFLRKHIDPGIRAAGKNFPLDLLRVMNLNEIAGLYNGLVASDGHKVKGRPQIQFSSASRDLCDLFCAVATRLGIDAHNCADQEGCCYRVNGHLPSRTSLESRRQYHGQVQYEGDVFCATTSTGWLAVRGNSDEFGFICGNSTPFEMCEIKYHVKLPIFVARQWIRHRTANVNEYSARYSVLDREFYVPAPEHLAAQATMNRQGRDAVLPGATAEQVLDLLREDATRCHDHYTWMLNDAEALAHDPTRPGLARELARMNLTLNTYTQWYWKIDLHNLLHFLALRADPHAQYEIRAYAEVIMATVRAWVPLVYQAFLDYRLGAFTLSAPMLEVVRRMLAGTSVAQPESGLSKREWTELMAALGR